MTAPGQGPAFDRSEIEACLLRYTRGIDRLDSGLVASAFHPGASLEGYGRPGAMTIEAFIDHAMDSLRNRFRTTQHRLSNITVTSTSSGLLVESYVLAFHISDHPDHPDGPDQLLSFNGRYVDRFELRDRELRIAHRALRVDWTRVESVEQAMGGNYMTGTRDRSDVSYP